MAKITTLLTTFCMWSDWEEAGSSEDSLISCEQDMLLDYMMCDLADIASISPGTAHIIFDKYVKDRCNMTFNEACFNTI